MVEDWERDMLIRQLAVDLGYGQEPQADEADEALSAESHAGEVDTFAAVPDDLKGLSLHG